MANYEPCYEAVIRKEGGYVLHEVPSDRGGMTYAGIARDMWPKWPGWLILDADDEDNPELTQMVRDFYEENFWDKINGNGIKSQKIAQKINTVIFAV